MSGDPSEVCIVVLRAWREHHPEPLRVVVQRLQPGSTDVIERQAATSVEGACAILRAMLADLAADGGPPLDPA